MAKIEEKVEELVTKPINDLGYRVYDVMYVKEGKDNYLRIFIDKDEGISLNDCEKVNDAITDKDKLLELQKDCACPDNKLSTYVHELLHWKDATQYRQQYGAIKNNSTYINILRKKHKKQVDILEKRGYNINGISTYAYDSKKYNAYDEIFTEYRVKEILGG